MKFQQWVLLRSRSEKEKYVIWIYEMIFDDTKVIWSFLIIKGSLASCPAISASAAVSSNAEIFANPPKYRKIESDAKEYRSFVGQALFAKNEKGESIVEKFARTFKNMNHFQFYYLHRFLNFWEQYRLLYYHTGAA